MSSKELLVDLIEGQRIEISQPLTDLTDSVVNCRPYSPLRLIAIGKRKRGDPFWNF